MTRLRRTSSARVSLFFPKKHGISAFESPENLNLTDTCRKKVNGKRKKCLNRGWRKEWTCHGLTVTVAVDWMEEDGDTSEAGREHAAEATAEHSSVLCTLCSIGRRDCLKSIQNSPRRLLEE